MEKQYKPCEYCGGTKTQVSNYQGVVCKGCGAKVVEIMGFYYGRPFTVDDLLSNNELQKAVTDNQIYLSST